MTDFLSAVVEADELVLVVLVSFVLGIGVVIGRGYIQPAGGGSFLGFWHGFAIMVVWSVLTAVILALLGPIVVTLMLQFIDWVPALNLMVFGFAGWSMARQAKMVSRATFGIVALFLCGVVAFAIPIYFAVR